MMPFLKFKRKVEIYIMTINLFDMAKVCYCRLHLDSKSAVEMDVNGEFNREQWNAWYPNLFLSKFLSLSFHLSLDPT